MTAVGRAQGQGDGGEGLPASSIPPEVRGLDQDDFPREWNDEDYEKAKAFVKHWDGVHKRGATSSSSTEFFGSSPPRNDIDAIREAAKHSVTLELFPVTTGHRADAVAMLAMLMRRQPERWWVVDLT